MTVDTVVKVVESEKCGLDMSCYEDLHSANVGGNGNVSNDCNSDGKDDYVFVNGSDVVSSDDQVESREIREVNVTALGVEGNDNVEVEVVDVPENDGVENGVSVEGKSKGGVEGGGLDEEIKSENEIVAAENSGNYSNVEGEVSVKVFQETERSDQVVEPVVNGVNEGFVKEPVVDQVKESSGPEPVVEQVKEVESGFECGDKGYPSVESSGSHSLDIDQEPNVDEANEDCVQEPVVDQVEESSGLEPVVDQVDKSSCLDSVTGQVEVRSGFEFVDNSSAAVDSTESRSLDVDQELIADDVHEVCLQEPVDQVKESRGPEPVVEQVKDTESVLDSGDNGSLAVDSSGRRSSDVDQEPIVDEVNEGGLQVPVVDQVKGSSDPKPVVEQVKDVESVFETGDNETPVDSTGLLSLDVDQEPVVDELSEGCAQEPAVDHAKESSDPEPVIGQVKDVESVFEDSENGTPSVDSIGPLSLDVDQVPVVDEVNEGCVQELVVDQAKESSDPQPTVDQVEDIKLVVETGNNGSPSDNSISSRSLDVDDNCENSVSVIQKSAGVEAEYSVPDAQEPSVVEAQIDTPEGELETEQHVVLPLENGIIIQGSETKRLEDQAGRLKVTENNDYGHEVEIPVAEVQSLEVSDHSVENSLAELQSLDGDVKGSLPQVDGDVKGSLPQDVEDKGGLPPDDGKSEKRDLAEVEANINKQGDADPLAAGGSRESVDLDAAGCELDQGVEPEETPDLLLPNHFEGEKSQSNLELPSTGIENSGSSQSDGNRIDSTSGVEDISGALTVDMQFDTTAESAVEDELERVDGDGESKDIAETGGSQEASPEEGGLQDQETGSFNVVDKEISSEDFSSEKTITVDETTSISKLQHADNTAMGARDNVLENKVVPASDESSEDAGSGLISEDNESKAKAAKSEIDVGYKPNNVSDGTMRAQISFGSFGCVSPSFSHNDINLGSDVLNKSTAISTATTETLLNSQTNGDHPDELEHDTACAQVVLPINEVSPSMEGSEADSSDGQTVNPDLVKRPFYWLIKVPRFDEGKFKDQLSQCEIELAEKTKARDAFQADFTKQQAYCRELKSIRDAANSEVKAARELVWAKSREVDSAHALINLARNAITVEDIDKKIFNLEHTLQHQTLNNLREEKELVREIKQLNLQRQKLLADPQRQQEVQQAHNQRGQTEDQLKVLKKELDALRDNLSKADERFKAAKKKHDDESALLNDLKQQLRSADDTRQEAYAHLIKVKKQLNEKNGPFYKAKNDLRVAYNYATAGNKDSLESHCVNQVEKIMEMWNTNDEFRKEYIQCNMRRVLWKFGTLDGTCLGVDEVPPSMGNVSNNRINTSANVNSATRALTVVKELPVEAKPTEEKLLKKVEQKKAPPPKEIESISKDSLAKASVITEIEENTEPKLTKEEEELARKAEQLRKEEEAARLREQLRLEEKAKAEEALERKRRNALKAQARAEFRARKEAEAKEKEREKRAKKKEKKRGLNSEISENVPAQPTEPSSESPKEPEITERSSTVAKRPQKLSLHTKPIKTTKPIPPALRNKGKRGFLRYWPYACIVLLAIALFYLGSVERLQTIKQHISSILHR
ncbi:uncharacterized protein LOC141653851 [Silene latifolia]|uniref:uncharacterized protein LOC141653851 n=1 Tax=Silene latifolia TaxID=37657 RepID=UPI003D7827EB